MARPCHMPEHVIPAKKEPRFRAVTPDMLPLAENFHGRVEFVMELLGFRFGTGHRAGGARG